MESITFVIAVAALLIAGMAFQRTGGIEELKRQVEAHTFRTDGMRDRTSDVLDRLERVVRGKKVPLPVSPNRSRAIRRVSLGEAIFLSRCGILAQISSNLILPGSFLWACPIAVVPKRQTFHVGLQEPLKRKRYWVGSRKLFPAIM